MSDHPPEQTTTALALRWFDASASDEDVQALWNALLTDPDAAREFANVARFEAILKQQSVADSKAFLELAALSSEMTDADVFETAPPASKPKPVAPARPRWTVMKMAAGLLAFFGLTALLCHYVDRNDDPAPGPQGGALTRASGKDSIITVMRPRSGAAVVPVVAAASVTPDTASLPERLDNFFLPEVALDRVPFRDAARWLTARLREFNFLKRQDFNRLEIVVPANAGGRLVTLHSGPISFFKAVQIVSRLALCEAEFTDTGITLVDRVSADKAARWATVQNGGAPDAAAMESKAGAIALGLDLPESAWRMEAATGTVSVNAAPAEAEALRLLAESRRQLADMAPLALMPIALPAGSAGPDRVLSAAEVDSLRQQLGQVPGTAPSVPVIVVPRTGGTGDVGAPPAGSARPQFIITATPVGEMDRIRIDSVTPPAVSPQQIQAPPSEPRDIGPFYVWSGTQPGNGSTASYSDASGSTGAASGSGSGTGTDSGNGTGVDGYIDDGMGLLVTVVGDMMNGMWSYDLAGGLIPAPPPPETSGGEGETTLLLLPVPGGS